MRVSTHFLKRRGFYPATWRNVAFAQVFNVHRSSEAQQGTAEKLNVMFPLTKAILIQFRRTKKNSE